MSSELSEIFGTRSKLTPVNGVCPNCGARSIAGMLLCPCTSRAFARPAWNGQPTAPAFTTDDRLRARQEYYQYDSRPLRMKEPPVLDRDLVNAMKAERFDRAYRFVWGGVVIVREEPDSDAYVIARGDKTACWDVAGKLRPKYVHEYAKQARGYEYTDATGTVVFTTDQNLIPAGYVVRVQYRYVDFGRLYWHLETRANSAELIRAEVYNRNERVPESDWTCIMCLQSKDGRYYDPSLEMMDVLRSREDENRNQRLTDVAQARKERDEKNRAEQALKEREEAKKSFGVLFDDVMKHVERAPKSTS